MQVGEDRPVVDLRTGVLFPFLVTAILKQPLTIRDACGADPIEVFFN